MEAAKQIQEPTTAQKNRALRILAKSIYRELTSQGYDEKQIVALATQLIGEVTHKIGNVEATNKS